MSGFFSKSSVKMCCFNFTGISFPFIFSLFNSFKTLNLENIIEFLWDEWMDSSGFNTFEVLDSFFKYVIEDRI